MCGFIGYISLKNSNKIDNYYKKFNFYFKKQQFRGPDYNEKFFLNKDNHQICLGFNRLTIIDQSQNGNKIFRNDRYILLFNGEIYNFQKLKYKYFGSDFFESKTDTELLFKFLIKFGYSRINELEGMFAFVLVDLKKKDIIFSRDYTGIKPLYYHINSDGIFFSSDAWFTYSISDKEIDPYSCKYYFQFGFTPKANTLIKKVKKVLPRNILKYNYDTHDINEIEYFKIPYDKNHHRLDTKILENNLSDTIEKNLISDTKVGIFLSGGIDSSIIAILSKKLDINISAYTSFFTPSEKYSKFNLDYNFAKKLCDYLNIKLHRVNINTDDLVQKKELISALKKLDEPIANLNFFNSFLQSKKAKEDNCKVILTGDGADEIFGGYERYQKCNLANKFKFLKLIFPKIKRLKNVNYNQLPEFFYNNLNISNENELFNSSFLRSMINTNSFKFFENNFKNQIDCINFFDLSYWITDEANFKLDRSSMLNSIEARVPFQDKNLIKDYFSISFQEKVDLFNVKKQLKKLDFLPKYIKNRNKRGWFSPESIFLRDYLKDLFYETFEESKINNQKIFNYKKVLNLYNLHNDGHYYKNQLLPILTFQIWYNQIKLLDNNY